MSRAYYNEIDPYAADWLRNLIAEGLIAPGDVDQRDIRDVRPDDLRGYAQCHFFAGICVWSHALRSAGWPDDRPVWTGSCPCQPFSAAGGRGGFADERHLWPAFHWLIEQCRPPVVLGEQVASKDGLAWLDLVQADMEGADYALGAVDLCAAGVGAPHIRQRLWFVGVADAVRRGAEHLAREGVGAEATPDGSDGGLSGKRLRTGLEGPSGGVDHHHHQGSQGHAGNDGAALGRARAQRPASEASLSGGMADGDGRHAGAEGLQRGGQHRQQPQDAGAGDGDLAARPTDGFWRDADWLGCRDGKWRPVEPGTFPLAHGAAARVGRLRAYGNAIVGPVAEEFVSAAQWATGADLA